MPNRQRKRAAIAAQLEAEARLYATYAQSTPQHSQLHSALLRLVAAQMEVAAILRAQNMTGGATNGA